MNITEKLDLLAEIQAALDLEEIEYSRQVADLIPPEIKALIAEVDAEHIGKQAEGQKKERELTAEVKAEVLAGGVTVKSAHLQAVYSKGASRWDMPELNRYAEDHLDLLRFKKEGEPSVSIRKVCYNNLA